MLKQTGVFVCGEKEAKAFPGALFFRRSATPASTLLVICKIGCRPSRICCSCLVEISGHFLHTTLRGLKVFEAETLQYCTSSSCCTHDSSEVPTKNTPLHWISGTVTSVSQCFKLKNGHTTFISLRGGNAREDTRLLLLEQAVQCSSYLSVGDHIEVCNSTRFRWKCSEDTASESSSTEIKTESNASSVFYFVDQVSNIRINTPALALPAPSSAPATAPSVPKKSLIPAAAALQNPRTLLQKELLSHIEFAHLTGTVRAVHTMGWIELSDVTLHEHYTPLCADRDGTCSGDNGNTASVGIANSSNGTHSGHKNISTGIQLQSCILYLAPTLVQHLRSSALGVSVRQAATIHVTNLIPTYLWGKLKGFTTTCRSALHIHSFAENKSFHSDDPTYCAVNISIPVEIKNSCVLYAVWRVEISRKLAHCVGAEVVQKHASLCSLIVQQIQSLATCSVTEVMRLPPSAVQDQLYNLQYILLHTMRNGLDSDWLGNNLPQLWSVSTLMSKLTHIHSAATQVPSSILFGMYHYDMCAVTPGSSIWSQYNAQHNTVVRKNIVIVGTVKLVTLPHRVQDIVPAPAPVQGTTPSTHTSAYSLAELVVTDASGGSIAVLVRDIDTMWLNAATQKCQSHLHSACTVCAVCSTSATSATNGGSVTHNNSTRRQQYCSCTHSGSVKTEPGSSSSSSSSAALHTNGSTQLYVVIHNPQCLLEQPPQLDTADTVGTSNAAKQRTYLLCSAVDVCFIGDPGAPAVVPAISATAASSAAIGDSSAPAARVTVPPIAAPVITLGVSSTAITVNTLLAHTSTHISPAMSVRQLLSLDLKQYNTKYITRIHAIVVIKQLIEVEYKTDTISTASDPKRRKLSAQQSVYEDTQRGFVAVRPEHDPVLEDRKCCITLRDVNYADVIHLFLPYRAVQCILVGSVVDVYSVYLCLPDNKKKLYLKAVEGANKTEIEMVGFVSGLQLQRLCEFSRYVPDPRFIDVVYQGSTTRCNFSYRPPGCVGLHSVTAGVGQEQGYLEPPPATNIRALTALSSFQRATWRLTGQVVYVRKITVSLRCTRCQTSAKRHTHLGGFVCAKCASVYTLKPLWEAQVAFDDGTGECLMHIEGEEVFLLIHARFDARSIVLREVRGLVDKYVERHGSLIYDAFAQPIAADQLLPSGSDSNGVRTDGGAGAGSGAGAAATTSKPYSMVADEQAQADAMWPDPTTTTTATVIPSTAATSTAVAAAAAATSSSSTVPKSSDSIFNIPLSEHRNSLISHLDLKTNPTHISAAAILKAYMQLGSYSHHYVVYCKIDFSAVALKAAQTKYTKREVKLQRNNAEHPYLAYFVLRPTHADAKLTVQVLNSRELHGELMTYAAWDLVAKLKQRNAP